MPVHIGIDRRADGHRKQGDEGDEGDEAGEGELFHCVLVNFDKMKG